MLNARLMSSHFLDCACAECCYVQAFALAPVCAIWTCLCRCALHLPHFVIAHAWWRGMTDKRRTKLISIAVQIGFLYLRYVCPPQNLLSWLEPHFGDTTVRDQPCIVAAACKLAAAVHLMHGHGFACKSCGIERCILYCLMCVVDCGLSLLVAMQRCKGACAGSWPSMIARAAPVNAAGAASVLTVCSSLHTRGVSCLHISDCDQSLQLSIVSEI